MSNGFGFAGGMGVGKTTAARILVEEHGFVQIGFATPLYEIGTIHSGDPRDWVHEVHEWTIRHMGDDYGWREKLTFVRETLNVFSTTPRVQGKNRTLLQLIGTEVGRNAVDPNLWTKLFEKAADEAIESGKRVVNDNVRFVNELASCARTGLTTVFIEVPEHVQDARYLDTYGVGRTAEQKVHASEAELSRVRDGCQYIYTNSGTLEDLRAFVDQLAREVTHA
jgi:dephospho-CoA kinase